MSQFPPSSDLRIPGSPSYAGNPGSSQLCIHELFEQRTALGPDAVAVFENGRSLTYSELNRRANQLARCLRARSVAKETLVGVCLQNSLDAVVSLLAVLKAGGAYVPLDPTYPPDRISCILSDSGCRVLIAGQNGVERIPNITQEILSLDAHWSAIANYSEENLDPVSGPENLAYVIYTSGSTGKPKGVQVEHHSVVNLLLSMQATTEIAPNDVFASVTTLSFDIAGLEIYLPLVSGASIAIVNRDDARDGKRLQARIQETGATFLQGTPALFRLLLESGWQGDKKLKVVCGGEAFPREVANALVAGCGTVWNGYGPTEATIYSSLYRVPSIGEGVVPIGRAVRNTYFQIVDEHLKPVPSGQEGQLLIGGEGVARGYLNRDELTREKFIPDHSSHEAGARLYQTGDLVRLLPDGDLAFLGRIDHQVKIRGYRIELGEVESVLNAYPAVRQCVVIAREDSPGDKRLAAYVVAAAGQHLATKKLREFLRTKLPEYMIPAAFVVLDALPLTPNGKVDRKALPRPTRDNSALLRLHVPARDSFEKELVSIFEHVLKIKPIGITDNIFELGVDSLLAQQLLTRIEMRLAKSALPTAPLFQAPTIETLATLLRDQHVPARKWTSLVPIQSQGTKTPLFCVHGAAGTVLGFYPLARRLAPNRPVYGLRNQGLFGIDLPHSTVEDMAAHYIKEIQTVQPHGPYLLAGWCFGGIIIFEMAQQLLRMGEKVDLLAMLNAPSTPEFAVTADAEAGSASSRERIRQRWEEFGNLRPIEKVGFVVRRTRRHFGWRLTALRQSTERFVRRSTRPIRLRLYDYYLHHRSPMPDFLRNSYFYMINGRAERQYRHQSYSGDVLLFRDLGPYSDPDLGWKHFVHGTIQNCEMPVKGTAAREMMHEPMVGMVAETIEKYLTQMSGPIAAAAEFPGGARLRGRAS